MKALDNRFYVKFMQLEIGLFSSSINEYVTDFGNNLINLVLFNFVFYPTLSIQVI